MTDDERFSLLVSVMGTEHLHTRTGTSGSRTTCR